jgi:O-acetyl-ADP-ribose deacetylase (regulator of RNase III)
MSKLVFKKGNMFESECEALVCPVNCFGVMGAGVAKIFREKFSNEEYKEECMKGALSPGAVFVKKAPPGQQTLIYLATKMDWRDDSKLEWIETGCTNLVRALYYYGIKSVALPALGTGKGNLPWPTVELINKTVFENDGLTKLIEVYEPIES